MFYETILDTISDNVTIMQNLWIMGKTNTALTLSAD